MHRIILEQHIQHSLKECAPDGPISKEQCWTRVIYWNPWKSHQRKANPRLCMASDVWCGKTTAGCSSQAWSDKSSDNCQDKYSNSILITAQLSDQITQPWTQPFRLKIDWYIRPIFGFCWYIGIDLSRCWQNVIFLTHADNLHRKAQWTKSRQLSCSNASRCVFINKKTR